MKNKQSAKPNRLKSALKKVAAKKPPKDSKTDRFALIRAKAYEFYERRGRTDGNDWEDWFEAEKAVGPF